MAHDVAQQARLRKTLRLGETFRTVLEVLRRSVFAVTGRTTQWVKSRYQTLIVPEIDSETI